MTVNHLVPKFVVGQRSPSADMLAPRFTPVAWAAGGVGRAGRIYSRVAARFVVGIAAVAAEPATMRSHPPGRWRSFQPCAAAVAAGNRYWAGSAGSTGFPASRCALLACGTGRTVRRIRENHS
jgi:hypothetical protein